MNTQIQTILTLTATTNPEGSRQCASLTGLAARYRDFLHTLKQRPISGSALKPMFVMDAATQVQLSRLFCNDSLLDDKAQGSVITDDDDRDIERKKDIVIDAIHQLGLQSPQHAALFDIIVTDILLRPSAVAKGGSTSQAIGLIWLNPRPDYGPDDVVEILVHELTHHAMFLDELRHAHYNYSLLFDSDTWTTSAILRTPRPLDKVLHSIVVAAEVLLFRERCSGHPAAPRVHPPSHLMLEQLRESIQSTKKTLSLHPEAFRPRATALLRQAASVLDELSPAASDAH
ncbi:HEXXH motif-containing putative peptide modification protein [Cupriavidus sp. UGS-1]|uniref:aKG-HExxH-type peptide beta-hydroxylase n=1 Tax=Cupriavidus sp. UGS-1 TaxID=2899826 RepID=UPI001E622B43|nr:HEXXH motif-containing putative peptide modification protein [Cupriavidus sp. UGS-1]MCD9123637.1 HEXXH motif-containing putative peptide modification protein [Cupriavidus sp. UGS-1]